MFASMSPVHSLSLFSSDARKDRPQRPARRVLALSVSGRHGVSGLDGHLEDVRDELGVHVVAHVEHLSALGVPPR